MNESINEKCKEGDFSITLNFVRLVIGSARLIFLLFSWSYKQAGWKSVLFVEDGEKGNVGSLVK